MKNNHFFPIVLLVISLTFASCYSPHFLCDLSLYQVEVQKENTPEKVNIDTILLAQNLNDSIYHYDNDIFTITWGNNTKELFFSFTNKSNYPIAILWDEMVYIDILNQVNRITHKGVRYLERNNAQPTTIVPRNSTLWDLVMPTDNIYYETGNYGGWREANLFYFPYKDAAKYINSRVRVYFPILINGEKYSYTFEFKIDKISLYY